MQGCLPNGEESPRVPSNTASFNSAEIESPEPDSLLSDINLPDSGSYGERSSLRRQGPEKVAEELLKGGLEKLIKFLGIQEVYSSPILSALSTEHHPIAERLLTQSLLLAPWTFDLTHGSDLYRERATLKTQAIAAGSIYFHEYLIRKDPALADDLIAFYSQKLRKRDIPQAPLLAAKIRDFYLKEVGTGLGLVRSLLKELEAGKCDTAMTDLLRGALAPYIELSSHFPPPGIFERIFSSKPPKCMAVLFDRDMTVTDGTFFNGLSLALEKADLSEKLKDESYADPALLKIRDSIRGDTERLAALDVYLAPHRSLSLADLYVILDAIPLGQRNGRQNSFGTLRQYGGFDLPSKMTRAANSDFEPTDIRLAFRAILLTDRNAGQALVNLISRRLERIISRSVATSHNSDSEIAFSSYLTDYMKNQLGKTFARSLSSQR